MKNRLTELLGIEKPVLEAAMLYLCDANLAAAVSNAGGLGLIGINSNVTAPQPDAFENGENLRREIKKLRTLTDKPFAVNYLPSTEDTMRFTTSKAKISFSDVFKKVIIEEKVPVVVAVSTIDNANLAQDFKDFHDNGIIVIYRDLNCTVDACVKAAEYGADAVIVTGAEAGGHSPKWNMSLSTILPMVLEKVKDIPVIGAGAIVGKAAAAGVCAMGAEGVYCGSVFEVAKECRAHANYKQAILDAKGEDIIRWSSSVSSTKLNTIPNLLARSCAAMAAGGASAADIGALYNKSVNLAMIEGDTEHGCIPVSAAVGALKEIKSAKEFVDDIAAGFGA
ncbi:MAG: nitronate monooxygenase [Lachnospiraceae bacterium]|nr:nitronate monooxygenase [Lachnospiraceae bacterium]